MNIQHSSRTDDWHTPEYIIKLINQVLIHIDLDPASDNIANQIIKADRIITKEQDGLITPWAGNTIFINPPGSKINNKSLSILFWQKLMNYVIENNSFAHAIYMGFSVEQLAVSQGKQCKSILQFPICVPAKRIKFNLNGLSNKHAPSHSNVIVYIPGHIDNSKTFKEVFSTIGDVKL